MDVATPRIDLSTGEKVQNVYTFLELIDHTILTHFQRSLFCFEIYADFAEHLKSGDRSSSSITDHSYSWLQPILSKGYGDNLTVYSESEQQPFIQEIFSLTDYTLIKKSVTPEGGGAGRNPTGTFCEQAISYLSSHNAPDDEYKKSRIVMEISDLFFACTNCWRAFKTFNRYLQQEERSLTNRMYTPQDLKSKLQDLARKFSSPTPTPLSVSSSPLPNSSSSSSPQLSFLNLFKHGSSLTPPAEQNFKSLMPSKPNSNSFPKIPALNFSDLSAAPKNSSPANGANCGKAMLSPNDRAAFEESIRLQIKNVLEVLDKLSAKIDTSLSILVDKSIKILPPELPIIFEAEDLIIGTAETKELFSRIRNQKLPLESVSIVRARVEAAEMDRKLDWKTFHPAELKEMPYEDRKKILTNSAYTLDHTFKNYELSILIKLVLNVLRPLQAEESLS